VAYDLAAAGHRSAAVVPLLFTSAFHATVDVPQAIEQASATSGLDLAMTTVLGTGMDVEHLVRETMAAAGITPGHSVLLYAVGSSNAAANDDVHALAARLGRDRLGAVRAGFATSAPRGSDVLAELPEPIAVVPLFLAPGLLLDPMAAQAADRGWPMTPPLAERAAPIVARRYQQLVASRATSASTR
jgi:sirohydrochlorin ferrochelatase